MLIVPTLSRRVLTPGEMLLIYSGAEIGGSWPMGTWRASAVEGMSDAPHEPIPFQSIDDPGDRPGGEMRLTGEGPGHKTRQDARHGASGPLGPDPATPNS